MAWKTGILFLAGALLVSGSVLLTRAGAVQGQGGNAAAGRHSVVNTDGAHLIVTDNVADKLYFYTIDKDGKIGDELKLRGTIDLADVGKASLKPIDAKPQR